VKSSVVLALLAASLFAVPLVARAADAQPRQLCADRPGKATPPCIVDVGRWQLEVGVGDVSWQRGGGQRDDVYALGGFELRTGVTRTSEIELAWTPWSIERQSDAGGHSRASGVGDLQLGFRQALTDPDSSGLAVSVEPFVTAPTATRHQGAGGWEGGVLAPVAGQVTDTVAFGLTPELDVVRDAAGGGTHLAWAGAAGVSRGFGPATLGVELWGQRDDDPAGATTQASFDLTAAYVPAQASDLQLDAGVNVGLNRNTPDLEAYVGVSRRF
jgi:hypothetical protein